MKERAKTTQGRTRGVYIGDDLIDRTTKNGRVLGTAINRNVSFSEIVADALTLWNTAFEKRELRSETLVAEAKTLPPAPKKRRKHG